MTQMWRWFEQIFTSRKVFVLLFCLFLGSRVIHLLADPPQNLCFSLGLFFDEGIYNHNARNLIRFGQAQLDEWNDYYYSAVSTWLKYGVFQVIGIGRAQIRLFSIAFSLIGLLFVYLACKESYGKPTALTALLLFGTNYIALMYSRVGMQDTQTLTVWIIAFYCWQKGMVRHLILSASSLNQEWAKGGWFFLMLAGAVAFLSYTFKNLFLYLLPVPVVAWLFYLLLQTGQPMRRKPVLTAGFWLGLGLAGAFLLWWLTFYLPYRTQITQFGSFFTTQQMFPTVSLQALWRNWYQTPLFKYFSNTPVVLVGSLLFVLVLYFRICSDERHRIPPADIFLLVWFWAAFAFLGIIAYRPTRYFLPIIPPMCMLAARLVSLCWSRRLRLSPPGKVHWGWYPLALLWLTLIFHRCVLPWGMRLLRPSAPDLFTTPRFHELVLSAGVALLLTISFALVARFWQTRVVNVPRPFALLVGIVALVISVYWDGKYYMQWARFPAYTVHQTGQDLVRYIGQNGYLGGMDAPGVAFDTPYKTLISWDGYVNFKDNPITKYGLTHLFLADSRSIREKDRYFQKYPQEMQQATLLQQYTIKGAEFSLFSLVEPTVAIQRVEQQAMGTEKRLMVTLTVQNPDARQARKLMLNWRLYPWDLTVPEISPVCAGQAQEVWLTPNQTEVITINGDLPEQSGQYRLFVMWEPTSQRSDEVEDMARHLGKVMKDREAMGNAAVVYDPGENPAAGFLAFGNYRYQRPGVYEAVFRVKVPDNSISDPVLRVDIAANSGKTIVAQRDLRGQDFPLPQAYHTIIVPFALTDAAPKVECRIFSTGHSAIWADQIIVLAQPGIWRPEPLFVAEERESYHHE